MHWVRNSSNFSGERRATSEKDSLGRLNFLVVVFGIFLLAIIGRLFYVQVLSGKTYAALSAGQHDLYKELFAERGEIFIGEMKSENIYPIAANREYNFVYAEPVNIKEKERAAKKIAEILSLDEAELLAKFSKEKDFYEPIKHEVTDELTAKIKDENLAGIKFSKETKRYYPEAAFGGELTGFLGYKDTSRVGFYGLEGYFERELSGKAGFIEATKDALGALIPSTRKLFSGAENGDDIVLTIDRNVQAFVCDAVRRGQEKYGAASGVAVVMNPENGEILALCAAPDFDPNEYSKVKDMKLFSHGAVSGGYEPGSVFKPITMAIAIEEGKVAPESTYFDTGEVKVHGFTIKNSDGKANGTQTMTQVLEKSLNTGAVYVVRKIGSDKFRDYVKNLGFGELSGIELDGEIPGDISQLSKKDEIYSDTASYGQGIVVTPIQLAAAFAALGNGGYLVRPHLVREFRHADGTITEENVPPVRQIFSARTSKLVSAMLVSVVENGHGKKAGVAGYVIGGKTGTAQVAKKNGPGYEENEHIGTFAGYAPADSPKFVIVVKFDRPQNVDWAESSAAPVFGEIARFLLNYLEIPPSK
jgi:cell division protein FtsI/penicillin-binding protein 2